MRRVALARVSALTIAWAAFDAAPAAGQEETETSSSGERYEFEDFYEYGNGSTTYTVNFNALIGSEEIGVGGMSRYFEYYTPEEIAQFAPPAYDYYIGGSLVSITGWSAAQFVSSDYVLIDVLSSETPYYDVVSITTTQRTSGDGPDAIVPIGWRGGCYADGTNGATNFDSFDGQFATCDYAESYVEVAPGTINLNTHSTTVYRQGTRYFQSIDDAYVDTYLFVPTATATTSSGERYESQEITEYGAGSTIYAVNLTADIGGEQVDLADLSRYSQAYGQEEVEEALPNSYVYMFEGVPVTVDAWAAPELIDSTYEVIDVFTEDTFTSDTFSVVTVQTTSGDAPDALVPIGWRGSCGSDGASGATNSASPEGAFAECDYADSYLSVAPGSTNTNTHTTIVYRDTHYHFESVDDGYTDSYVARPLATSTSSSGERYETEEITEYGAGSTIYAVNLTADIGGEQVDLASLSRYSQAYGQEEVEDALPGSYVYMFEGVPVTVDAWAAPELIDSAYEVIDVFTEDSTRSETLTVVTVQTTSGNGPDALVPVGSRGSCSTDGASGATNSGSAEGAFAECGDAQAVFAVAPGSTNTNTHTTTVYRDTHYHFESVDDAFTDTYLARPAATSTSSRGTLETTLSSSSTVRSDSHATRVAGIAGGETLFDRTIDGDLGDADVQSTIEALSRPIGYGFGGAPTVVVWSRPILTDTREVLSSSVTETETQTRDYQVQTVTQTQGGTVAIGDRGACTSTGASGATSGPSPSGSFAQCEGGVSYTLSPGETNTNTHTTVVTETTVDTLVTENWLTTESYLLSGTPVLIGQIHSAVRDALFAGNDGFARAQGDALTSREGLGFGLWAGAFAHRETQDANLAGPGSRHSVGGIAGGATFRVSGTATLGLAASYETGDSELAGLPESADVAHTQVGVAAEVSPGSWRFFLTAGRGWADIDTERGDALVGGVARADYEGASWFASVEAGPEFGFGAVTLRPLAGLEWSRVSLGAFSESGGIALAGDEDSASRVAATLGAQLAARWSPPAGPGFGVWADLRGGQVLDGKERDRAVVFAAEPDEPLSVTSASEAGSYAEGRAGVSLFVAGGIGLHLGAEGRVGSGTDKWRASAGLSAAF